MTASRLVVPRVCDGAADADTVAWLRALGAAFLSPALDPGVAGRAAAQLRGDRLRGVYEPGDPLPVATLRSWDARMTLPGGDVAVDAVASIGVRWTHRRRGLLRSVLADDLAAAADAGTPVAALTSTQGPLYERFGFGLATWTRTVTVDTGSVRWRDAAVAGSLSTVRPEEFPDLAAAVAERARRRHPGSLSRAEKLWRPLATGETPYSAMTPDRSRHLGVWRDDEGRPAGYVVHRVAEDWAASASGRASLAVLDLQATTPASYRELWRHLCANDLVGSVRWPNASVDEPLPWLLTDHRAVELGAAREMLWLRLLDVPAALTARRYPVTDRFRLRVLDDASPEWGFGAGGRFLLDTSDPVAPVVERLGPGADVDAVAPVAALGSMYLGGADPRVLARTDRLEEVTPGAAGRLARLLAAPSVPWNGVRF